MCGIIGVLGIGAPKVDVRAAAMRFLFTELLQLTEERGKDATGVSALFDNGMSYTQKGPVTATEFIGNLGEDETTFNSFLNNSIEYSAVNKTNVRLFMGHCRKSSVGGANDNVNNHPIKVNEIVGVHNGTLENHSKIFAYLKCKRAGVVDSEAIMCLLDYYTGHCTEPFTIEGLEETARRLEGAYSVIAYNANNPYQICVMRKERPFEMALLKDLGILLISSDKAFFVKALYQYNKSAYLFNDQFIPVDLTETEAFTLPLDNVGILDLAAEINEDTQISDLLVAKDIFKTPKLWKMPPKKYTNTYVGGRQYPQTGGKKNETSPNTAKSGTNTTTGNTTTQTQKHTTEPINDGSFKGKVWCKRLNAYVNQDAIDKAKEEGPKIISINGGTVTPIADKELVDFTEVNTLTPDPVETPVSITKSEVMTVDTTLTEAILAANVHENFSARYSNGKEVVEALGISSLDTLDNIPAHALLNKARETLYVEAFVDGALWHKEQGNSAEKASPADATTAVRVAKQVVDLFGTVIEQLTKGATEDYATKLLAELSKRKENTELTLDNVRKVFSVGDRKNCKVLTALEDLI